ncbi:MAG TPA: MopE-related protein [Myxococcota bacterium]|nr:MopE-related protein [Myxococcota bacterium]HRY94837.1 MopE-related protein [Myxococcota bacterium]
MRLDIRSLSLSTLCLALIAAAPGCPSGGSDFTDEDGDGWAPTADCNDADAAIHPLAEDIPYDGIDQDCSGEDMTDFDRDGYDATQVTGGTDCDDADPDVNPGAQDVPYDGVDRNCDGQPLNDVDGDGVDALVVGGADCCDDGTEDSLGCSAANAAGIGPAQAEISYDGIDQNCDGGDYAGGAFDADADGYLTDLQPEGIDCNDEDPLIHPQAAERCNEIDDDCDGLTDEALPDLDGDGHPSCCDCDDFDSGTYPGAAEIPYDDVDQDCDGADLIDVDGDGFPSTLVAGGLDCNDANADINPAEAEACNHIDDNCDLAVDETFTGTGDGDGDTYYGCMDCNDANPAINQGAFEVPGNVVDDNCNGMVDELDLDFDGHFAVISGGDDCCDLGSEAVLGCNAGSAFGINPAQVEIPYDGIDQDCNGADLIDADSDGHIAVQAGGDDCADGNPEAYPGHAEDCHDPADNNCDGPANEGCGPGADEDVRVDAGPFTMGRLVDETPYADQAPQHVVTLETFFMDKYEVTISQYRRCVMDGYCYNNPLFTWSQTDELYWMTQARGLHPAIGLDWYEAQDYCAWAGKSLPTEAQWEKAARGPGARIDLYPWGPVEYTTPAGGGAQVRLPVACDRANHTHLCTGEPCEQDVVAVDRYPTGVSFYGVFNLSGNVWEWVSDFYQWDYYTVSPADDPTGPGDTGVKVLRGGSLSDLDYQIELTQRSASGPFSRASNLGFRCARIPPQAP